MGFWTLFQFCRWIQHLAISAHTLVVCAAANRAATRTEKEKFCVCVPLSVRVGRELP